MVVIECRIHRDGSALTMIVDNLRREDAVREEVMLAAIVEETLLANLHNAATEASIAVSETRVKRRRQKHGGKQA